MSAEDGYPGEMDDLNPDELVGGPLAGLANVFGEPDDRHAAEVRREVDRQQADYLEVYRGVLGFGYLVLAR